MNVRVGPANGRIRVAGRFTLAEKASLAAEIAASYARARWWLRRATVQEATAEARRRGAASGLRVAAGDAWPLAWRLGRIVDRALDRLPGDTRCLTRSLVLVQLLARRGIPSTLVIGVKPTPFLAHAWVEHDGKALLDPADFASGRLTEI